MANITIIIDGKTYKPLNENEITIEKENDGTTTIRHRISRLCCEETDKMVKITETGGSWEDIEKEAAEYCKENKLPENFVEHMCIATKAGIDYAVNSILEKLM